MPDDERNFSKSGINMMRLAARYIGYLINEAYDLKQVTTFVGNHFLLSERQRLAVMRSLATEEQLENRKNKQVELGVLAGQDIWIDGVNTVITLEVMQCDSILLECMDGTIRDLAALRGTYRIIPATGNAVKLLLDAQKDTGSRSATILLNAPVSNSGRLKSLIAENAEDYPFGVDIQVMKDVDRELYAKENVVTSDSIILDRCSSWINLSYKCLKRQGITAFRVWE